MRQNALRLEHRQQRAALPQLEALCDRHLLQIGGGSFRPRLVQGPEGVPVGHVSFHKRLLLLCGPLQGCDGRES